MKSKKTESSSTKPKTDSSAFSFEKRELEIEKLSLGGDGIARQEGLVYFVPLSVPGDRLLVQVTEKKKNFSRAEILEVLTSGPARQTPPCPVFGRCGGCNWQQLSYQEQLSQKQKIVEEQLSDSVASETQLFPIIPSPNPFRYRNRIQLKFDGKNLGFFARQSHDIIAIDDCLISEDLVAKEISALRKSLIEKKSAAIPKIEISLTAEGKVATSLEESCRDGSEFSQVNTLQNSKLVETVLLWLTPQEPRKIYDLYAGGGNFTFPLLRQFPKAALVGVELNSKSVGAAQKKIRELNLSPLRMNFFLSDVEIFLKKQPLEENSVVLLDPPRSGCSVLVVRTLALQNLKKIIYLSCNPAALARDLELFREFGGWQVSKIQPFDMFPQTDHIETLVELSR